MPGNEQLQISSPPTKVAPQKVSIINRNFCFLDEMCDENIPLPGFN